MQRNPLHLEGHAAALGLDDHASTVTPIAGSQGQRWCRVQGAFATCHTPGLDLQAFDQLATSLAGVRRTSPGGLARWQYDGRLVARALDATHAVIRAPFDVRDVLLHQHPETFSVPSRFTRHLMLVADLAAGNDDAAQDALESAWRFQLEE